MQNDLSRQLVEFLGRGMSANDMANKLNISNRQLYNYLTMLRNSGFDFKKNYCF